MKSEQFNQLEGTSLFEENSVPFNKPHITGSEKLAIYQVLQSGELAGDGKFTKKCNQKLEQVFGVERALLTHSCTAALEISIILSDIKPGDEVIVPSYTFVSCANAIALRGGVPVFVDIRDDTLNIDENLIEKAVTKRTKAIMPVHYAGVACEMDSINEIANKHSLFVIEDNAQGIFAKYKGKYLGTLGDFSAISFHETKNIIAGEGGVIFINRPDLKHRAEIIREKGTNRSEFLNGLADKYSWRDIGSSYLPGELMAAFLDCQLSKGYELTSRRLEIWNIYNDLLNELEQRELIRRPKIPHHCEHNGHIYHVLLAKNFSRKKVLSELKSLGVNALSHFEPLHLSQAGLLYGRSSGNLTVTIDCASRLVRLPLWPDMTKEHIIFVVENLKKTLSNDNLN